ncbi:ribosome maturation factor RimP [Peptoanaerobacter stomatis]|uniref:ribosome maturation factor RimP n=1 Tax=Peptoanaerobacter stomatis TaxID=796937 RepID=UPI003F9F920D
MSRKIEQLAEKLVTGVISDEYELVDVEYVKENKEMYLRILIDKAGGMSIDDCEELSRIIGDKLDEDDFIEDHYYLEISSPGLDRTLKKDRDFIREAGKLVEVKLFKAIEKYGKEFVSKLNGLNGNMILLEIDGDLLEIDKKSIAKINLYIEF